VHFTGPRRDLGDLLGAMDVFAMPSLWEGLPLSLVLAMSAAVPVVATAVAGIPEVVDGGRTGLLVPPGDAPALGAALARLFGDPALRRRMGADGQASVLPRFGVERYVQAIAGLYDELLATKLRLEPRSDEQSIRESSLPGGRRAAAETDSKAASE
jgi:glycosyltransferase involved in cell wall biosynthesis